LKALTLATANDVAQWMASECKKEGSLYQKRAAGEIPGRFGDAFTYINQRGNEAIDPAVLSEFRKMTRSFVIWDPGRRVWRKREVSEQFWRAPR